MKLHLLAVVLLPAAAAAQFSPISPRINPLVGLPAVLPSPAISPLSGGIQLPTPMPALTPSLILAAPAVSVALSARAAAAAPLAQPAVSARRENVSTPLSGLPAAVIRVENRRAADKAPAVAPTPEVASDQESLDQLFDRGETRIGSRAANSSRRIGLPEQDLERELGLN
ncbi:MAG: hypothetical protein HKL90_15140 [Elusimicrobia bacterium]|nr:hypothetical protein [Elusimicrobiota bacterium]